MKPRRSSAKLIIALAFSLCAAGLLLPSTPATRRGQKYVVTPVAQKKIKELPAGPLYWRVENFPTLDRRESRGRPRWLEPCFGTV